jgi:hypothetical protein
MLGAFTTNNQCLLFDTPPLLESRATVEGTEPHCNVWSRTDMSMKGVGCLNHNPQHDTSDKSSECPSASFDCETKHISEWGCILMTTGRSSRSWNKLYMYGEDLLHLWSEQGTLIITQQHDFTLIEAKLLDFDLSCLSGIICLDQIHASRLFLVWYNLLFIILRELSSKAQPVLVHMQTKLCVQSPASIDGSEGHVKLFQLCTLTFSTRTIIILLSINLGIMACKRELEPTVKWIIWVPASLVPL